jgi:hypothetical protein
MNVLATYSNVQLASWWATQAFAASKGLTVVDLDDVKTGEKLPGEHK